MRGEPNKKWNKRITRPCPMCGGRVIVANRNQSWWIRCDDDPLHIKYKPYEDPYSAIRAFNAQTNADRIRAMTDEELAKFLCYWDDCSSTEGLGYNTERVGDCWLCTAPGGGDIVGECQVCAMAWLKSPVEVDNG